MSYRDLQITVEWATRICEVGDEIGYFHTWEQWSNVINASPLAGGHPGGQVSRVYGIVEFPDGVRRVSPTSIKFRDEINEGLTVMNSRMKGETNESDLPGNSGLSSMH